MVDNSERIDKFLKKQMTPEEEELFLNDIKVDTTLRREAQITALMIQQLQERQAKEDALIIGDILASKKKAKVVGMIRWTLSIAAMFILIFGATLLWNKQSNVDVLFPDYYTSYAIQGESRGGNSDIEKELATLFNKVGTTKDITPVIEQLQKIHDSIDSEYEYSLYADDITWYLALAYLKDNKPDKVKELIKPLIEKGDKRAKALFNAIK